MGIGAIFGAVLTMYTAVATRTREIATLRALGFAFLFAPNFHPAMKHAGPTRREMGVRTAFNLLGPLTNPAGATRQVVGVPRADLTDLLARDRGWTNPRPRNQSGCEALLHGE